MAPLFQQTVACGLVRGGALFIVTSFQRETNVLRICPEEFEHVISHDCLGRLRLGRLHSIGGA